MFLLIEKDNEIDDFENHLLLEYKNTLNKSALIIPAKIAGAFHDDTLYVLKIENATIIRKEATTILVITSGLRMCDFKEIDYLELIRNDIEAFRTLFTKWVKTFDEWNYSIDKWDCLIRQVLIMMLICLLTILLMMKIDFPTRF